MQRRVIISALGVLAACQRPLPAPQDFQAVSLLPLTVEQALPPHISPLDVRENDGCYFYRDGPAFRPIRTISAPDAIERCAA